MKKKNYLSPITKYHEMGIHSILQYSAQQSQNQRVSGASRIIGVADNTNVGSSDDECFSKGNTTSSIWDD